MAPRGYLRIACEENGFVLCPPFDNPAVSKYNIRYIILFFVIIYGDLVAVVSTVKFAT